jgi:predicted HD superfamily hydrolase involved in NAD metabolism
LSEIESRLRDAIAKLPDGLTAHILRVLDEALHLAPAHEVDPSAVTVAVLGHDLFRAHPPAELRGLAAKLGYKPDPVEGLEPILLHGPLAARILRDEYGVSDDDVLRAAEHHTTAGAGMSTLQKLVFVADKIEPHKRARAAAVEEVAHLASSDLDAALLAYLDHHLRVAADTGWPLHPNTIAARNELIAAMRARN